MIFSVKDRANNLFKQVHDGKTLRGRSNDAIASACLCIACRQEGVPRTFKGTEICIHSSDNINPMFLGFPNLYFACYSK